MLISTNKMLLETHLCDTHHSPNPLTAPWSHLDPYSHTSYSLTPSLRLSPLYTHDNHEGVSLLPATVAVSLVPTQRCVHSSEVKYPVGTLLYTSRPGTNISPWLRQSSVNHFTVNIERASLPSVEFKGREWLPFTTLADWVVICSVMQLLLE